MTLISFLSILLFSFPRRSYTVSISFRVHDILSRSILVLVEFTPTEQEIRVAVAPSATVDLLSLSIEGVTCVVEF